MIQEWPYELLLDLVPQLKPGRRGALMAERRVTLVGIVGHWLKLAEVNHQREPLPLEPGIRDVVVSLGRLLHVDEVIAHRVAPAVLQDIPPVVLPVPRKIEDSVHELVKTDGTIRIWAREHDLKKYPLFSHIWIC